MQKDDVAEVEWSTGRIIGNGQRIDILGVIGRGTQGTVYRIKTDSGNTYALKLYHDSIIQHDSGILSRISKLVEIGPPSTSFCWALDCLEVLHEGESHYGYIMSLREDKFIAPAQYLSGGVEMSFRALFKACKNLAESFSLLHLRGLCYKDVSINNFFFDPWTGDVSIIDIDNVCYDNSFSYESNVLGTPRFMAPEIVEGASKPSIATDQHSLAVLLFYLLLLGHPLEGRKEAEIRIFDGPAQKHLYGEQARYIFDLDDSSNRPDPEIHAPTLYMADILPEEIMATFDDAFSKGLHNPSARVADSKWCIEIDRLIKGLGHCYSCGQEIFAANREKEAICWKCRTKTAQKEISFNTTTNVAAVGLQLRLGRDIVGEVVGHPADPRVLGIRNKTNNTWSAKLGDGSVVTIKSGRSIVIGSEISIDAGDGNAIVIKE